MAEKILSERQQEKKIISSFAGWRVVVRFVEDGMFSIIKEEKSKRFLKTAIGESIWLSHKGKSYESVVQFKGPHQECLLKAKELEQQIRDERNESIYEESQYDEEEQDSFRKRSPSPSPPSQPAKKKRTKSPLERLAESMASPEAQNSHEDLRNNKELSESLKRLETKQDKTNELLQKILDSLKETRTPEQTKPQKVLEKEKFELPEERGIYNEHIRARQRTKCFRRKLRRSTGKIQNSCLSAFAADTPGCERPCLLPLDGQRGPVFRSISLTHTRISPVAPFKMDWARCFLLWTTPMYIKLYLSTFKT